MNTFISYIHITIQIGPRTQKQQIPKTPAQTQNPQITNSPTGRHQHKPQNTITRARARIPYNKKRAHVHTYAHAQD